MPGKKVKSKKKEAPPKEHREPKLTNSVIKKFCRANGITRVSKPVYDLVREIVRLYLTDVAFKAIIVLEIRKAKKLSEEDIMLIARQHCGKELLYEVAKETKTIKSSKKSKKEGEEQKEKRKRKPGKKAEMEGRALKKGIEEGKLIIPKASFAKLFKSLLKEQLSDDKKQVGKNAMTLLQVWMEHLLHDLIALAHVLSKHANRKGVKESDVRIAQESLGFSPGNCVSFDRQISSKGQVVQKAE